MKPLSKVIVAMMVLILSSIPVEASSTTNYQDKPITVHHGGMTVKVEKISFLKQVLPKFDDSDAQRSARYLEVDIKVSQDASQEDEEDFSTNELSVYDGANSIEPSEKIKKATEQEPINNQLISDRNLHIEPGKSQRASVLFRVYPCDNIRIGVSTDYTNLDKIIWVHHAKSTNGITED